MRSPAAVIRAIQWRFRFLRDPASVAARDPAVAGARDGAVREALIEAASTLPLRERTRFITPFGSRREIEDFLMLRRLRFDRDGQPFFDLGRQRLFFLAHAWQGELERLLEGIVRVLKEAYLAPLDFFSTNVRVAPGDVVLDLGGNIGTSALLFSRLVGPRGRVITFEPLFADVLRRNLALNDADNVDVVPHAVAAVSGEAEFEITDQGIDARIRASGAQPVHSARVPVTTIDSFVADAQLERVNFMKMDVEGAEEMALRGASCTLRRLSPALSIASYHTDPLGRQQHPRLVRILRQRNYAIRELGQHRVYAWR